MLGPQVFYAYFRPFGLPIGGFFADYQHQIDVADGTDVNLSLIDLFVLETWRKKTIWMLLDPQILIDHENNIVW